MRLSGEGPALRRHPARHNSSHQSTWISRIFSTLIRPCVTHVELYNYHVYVCIKVGTERFQGNTKIRLHQKCPVGLLVNNSFIRLKNSANQATFLGRRLYFAFVTFHFSVDNAHVIPLILAAYIVDGTDQILAFPIVATLPPADVMVGNAAVRYLCICRPAALAYHGTVRVDVSPVLEIVPTHACHSNCNITKQLFDFVAATVFVVDKIFIVFALPGTGLAGFRAALPDFLIFRTVLTPYFSIFQFCKIRTLSFFDVAPLPQRRTLKFFVVLALGHGSDGGRRRHARRNRRGPRRNVGGGHHDGRRRRPRPRGIDAPDDDEGVRERLPVDVSRPDPDAHRLPVDEGVPREHHALRVVPSVRALPTVGIRDPPAGRHRQVEVVDEAFFAAGPRRLVRPHQGGPKIGALRDRPQGYLVRARLSVLDLLGVDKKQTHVSLRLHNRQGVVEADASVPLAVSVHAPGGNFLCSVEQDRLDEGSGRFVGKGTIFSSISVESLLKILPDQRGCPGSSRSCHRCTRIGYCFTIVTFLVLSFG
mmetsp:Transcript_32230/g.49839  ORF Transcript_32230/g.49839 Transcript_32230/m.49839 type:complete len:534 (-) Transcript_32230:577-2178(-)